MTDLKKYKMFIDGEWGESDTKRTFFCNCVLMWLNHTLLNIQTELDATSRSNSEY